MDKILQTQLTNVYNKINDQAEALEMAARLLAQAAVGEGKIFIRGLGDYELLEDFIANGELALPESEVFDGISPLTSADRVLVIAKFMDEQTMTFISELESTNIEYVLMANADKSHLDKVESIHHFINLSSPREVIPTPDFDRIVNPHVNGFLYAYQLMYVALMEMIED